jgi:TonB family protein
LLGIPLSAQKALDQKAKDSLASLPCAENAVSLPSDQLMKLVVKRTAIEPPMMERLNLHGTVTVAVCVSSKGKVSAVAVIDGQPMAQGAVIESVRKWVFTPYNQDGHAKTVEGVLNVAFDFRSQATE